MFAEISMKLCSFALELTAPPAPPAPCPAFAGLELPELVKIASLCLRFMSFMSMAMVLKAIPAWKCERLRGGMHQNPCRCIVLRRHTCEATSCSRKRRRERALVLRLPSGLSGAEI